MTKSDVGGFESIIHLVAGGIAGTTGAVMTSPFEVVKTRLQSSSPGFNRDFPSRTSSPKSLSSSSKISFFSSKFLPLSSRFHSSSSEVLTRNPLRCINLIVKQEGIKGLFRGLGPTLAGVAPGRAIYFWVYSSTKKRCNALLPSDYQDTPFIHVVSAGCSGFSASTVMNPVWLVKTRLQLDRKTGRNSLGVFRCCQNIYSELGILGFWKGVTASYWGISETMIHFTIYEYLKDQMTMHVKKIDSDNKSLYIYVGHMSCGAISKTIASVLTYPHEVARTRLREEGHKYHTFWQTLRTVYIEEGRRGLYCGLTTQLIRQIPNTGIMLATYELVVFFLKKWCLESREVHL